MTLRFALRSGRDFSPAPHIQQARTPLLPLARDIITIGASAGGVEALQQLVRHLCRDAHPGTLAKLAA